MADIFDVIIKKYIYNPNPIEVHNIFRELYKKNILKYHLPFKHNEWVIISKNEVFQERDHCLKMNNVQV